MTEIGYVSLVLALVLAAYGAIVSAYGAAERKRRFTASGENAVYAAWALLSLASLALIYAFLSRDFQIEYVYSYSSRTLPLFYTLSSFWAGQKGSLLMWAWLLAAFSSLVLIQNRRQNRELIPYAISLLMIVLLFFMVLLVFVSNPFSRLPSRPQDGQGLNPLLQNPGMIFHPPSLFLGYVGFTIPFAFALAALLTGRLDDSWIRATRKWTLFSWYTLGIGILLGAQWAYVELGWGGYWAWDPVENASLMPWLVGTAYLHSVMIQEKRDMLKVWNMVLIILTFGLCIFGTFLTRSGLISSVHSFGESTVGPFFLGFLALLLGASFLLLFTRLGQLRSPHQLDSVLSRESSFLLNNWILVGAAFSVLWGTMFPVISEAIKGVKISVGPPFFNQVNVPIGITLLLITGICPLISWRKASARNFQKNFLFPLLASGAVGILLASVGIRHFYGWFAFTLCFFVIVTIGTEFLRGIRARRQTTGEGFARALFSMIGKNRRRYGGHIVHLGLVLIFLGITGSSAYKVEKEATLRPGQTVQIAGYTFKYEALEGSSDAHKDVVRARLSVYRDGTQITQMKPEKRFYRVQEQPTTEVAIYSTLKEDLYAILEGYDQKDLATFKLFLNPLVVWMWIGGLVITLGTTIAIWPEWKPRRKSLIYRETSDSELRDSKLVT
ncbi:MAG: heme lyase CcmF/NrfE family subunit [Nitrospinae bacterium]|nr:heme lyase CcmF/NrfE family subunit [Nitrospinota bacterium]